MAEKGKVDIVINADDKASGKMAKVGKSTDQMSAKFNKAKLAIVAMGVGLAVAIGKMVNNYSKAGDEVQKMAKRTGIATETLSEMRHVANLSGSSLGAFEKATRRMSKSIIDGQAGMETYLRAFRRIGIEVETLKGMSPEEQFWTISSAVADLTDETEKVATMQEIFGSRVGTELLPMLEAGAEGIADMREEAHELNLVFDQEAADAAAAFEDSKTKIMGAIKGMANEVASVLMPELTKFLEMMVEKLKPAIAWLSEHPEVTRAFLVFAAVLGGAAVVIGIAKFISMIASAIAVIKGMIIALISLHAIAGPGGWVKLAVGIGIAAASIAGIMKLMSAWNSTSTPAIPGEGGEGPTVTLGPQHQNYQHGGVVKGPIGQPVPVIAHGGEEFLGVGGRGRGGVINVYVGGSVVTEQELLAAVREGLLVDKERNYTSGL